jgi:hypothetical protein
MTEVATRKTHRALVVPFDEPSAQSRKEGE